MAGKTQDRTAGARGSDHLSFKSASASDAEGIAGVLHDLVLAGKRHKAHDVDFALRYYIRHPDQLRCTIATDPNGHVLGFQSLKYAVENNPYGVSVGWGVIGTHIRPSAARLGIGRALFAHTLDAALAHGLPAIDATIGAGNTEGLAYYEAMGFRTYRTQDGSVSKVYRINR